ncbi:UTP:RNA uridylyltransferase 1 isoform X2 [Abrus precatorius]|uniref:RNA uridylyltransferase n=1 Tax=Abrus precatorius TaxID=3816 RepID=A0A8B8JT23_ABRPR|nr:UTP:RNA uridylyltransferase 1 isoform X2 [Abrus precatorius]
MNGGGGDLPPPANGGEFLLSLIQGPNHHPQPPPQSPAIDPAVAVVGPTIPVAASSWPINGADHLLHHHQHQHQHQHHQLPPWSHTLSSSPYPPNFFGLPHNPFPAPRVPATHYPSTSIPVSNAVSLTHDLRKLGFPIEENDNSNNRVDAFVQQQKQQELKLKFGSLPTVAYTASEVSPNRDSLLNLKFNRSHNGFDRNLHVDPKASPNSNSTGNLVLHGNHDDFDKERRGLGNFRAIGSSSPEPSRVPPGFGNMTRGKGHWGRKRSEIGEDRVGVVGSGETGVRNVNLYAKRESVRMVSGERSNARGNVVREMGLPDQLDHPGPPTGSNLHSVNEIGIVEDGVGDKHKGGGRSRMEAIRGADVGVLEEQLADSLLLEDESDDKNISRQRRGAREKDARSSDSRGQHLLSQRARMYKRQMMCRRDIDILNVPFLAIYESLIPPEEEKLKQKQLLAVLEKLVSKEWPTAKLYLYGSCANSFGVSKSDIDVCLAIEEADLDKSKIIMKLADILQSDNLQNVQALTRARVPIVKLMDPVTGISCDICINNLLAVVNTKLLRDYARIDARLRQLAFIIKHWAKSRGVNETYHGTLSSYAYVLMCIHFLQLRRPAILPCLQEMEATYSVTVDDIDCTYFDQVEKLCDFGVHNKETIAQLVWGFFYYWAYCHDYANTVISVRTGSIISKREKDWTRRIGNDRHLICIEDPFEISHDLGRVVDKHSIKVLREEFERAADIMQYDPSPCIKLFEPYVPS